MGEPSPGLPRPEGERDLGALPFGSRLTQFYCSDGYRFYAHVTPPARTAPVGRVILLHGIRSHAGWYTRSIAEFVSAGYEVHFLDRRGSGLNTARRGDTPNFRRLLLDVIEYLHHVRQTKAHLPLFVAGISWGGKLALGVPAEKPGLVNGVLLLCPGLVAKIRPPFLTRVRIALARFLNPTKLFPIPLNEPELFTADQHWQQFIATDRHGLTAATARFLFESVRFDLHLRQRVRKVRTPVLLMLAGKDRILDNAGTRRYLTRLPNAKSVTVIDYPNAEHTLEFEPVDFLADALTWMRQLRRVQ